MNDVADKIRKHFSRFPQHVYPKGQILVFAEEQPTHIFYMVQGRVRQYDVSYRGDEVIVNVYKPGAFFPMSWAITRQPNKYFYKTEVETTLHIVPCDEALRFIQANPDVMFDLLNRLYRGMEGLLGRMVHLMSGTARSRMLYELIIECRRADMQSADGSYVLPISEVDLAARAGLSRETVSREMRKMKTREKVYVQATHIVVPDLAQLEKALGSEV